MLQPMEGFAQQPPLQATVLAPGHVHPGHAGEGERHCLFLRFRGHSAKDCDAFPRASAAILPKTDASACGAAVALSVGVLPPPPPSSSIPVAVPMTAVSTGKGVWNMP